ncbi:hypothetical protein G647_09539 [Cladophialophora carrionii CBS 160.54]|uniref:Nucleotide-diphospho-sugar transferase domain-containing protein n=1 Tax=Cladophialophora carrionii CBS 160.54 TaxID=1279043 RepID=V9DKC1_9EURO|nr:uncharacterized protein G647_09539 [Cladophialophora carrionii CBS 160.54]ETI27349.1 hypothetical protein G647_09539 [Cladophialophora carrionii CBS 160.54]
MISWCRLPTLCGIIILGLSLVYFAFIGPPLVHSRLDTANLWHTVAHSLHGPLKYTGAKTHTTGCTVGKPNLILSAVDGQKLEDQIFVFMQSLDVALGEELLSSQRAKACPPASVHVHVLVPAHSLEEISPAFKVLLQRYPALELVPALPDLGGVNVVLCRFKGWSEYLRKVSGQYDKVLAIDLDVVFQRNPFAMAVDPGAELLYFAEWRGLKIGQCSVHVRWFDGCALSNAINHNVSSVYMPLDRICAGSTYGTAPAMQIYLDLMAEELAASAWSCNDQAMHIHIYYSGLLDAQLSKKGIGRAKLVPNADALFGTVGTTPMVLFSEWGEILNEKGQVQHVVHQFKTHARLREIVMMKYGWLSPVGQQDAIPPVPELVEESEVKQQGSGEGGDSASSGTSEEKHAYHHPHTASTAPDKTAELKRYQLAKVSNESCNAQGILCSCRHYDCQMHYELF